MQTAGRTTSRSFNSHGFSLVELMVVVAIIGILAAVAVPAYMNHIYRTRQASATQTLMEIKAAQEIYYAMEDQYAASINNLEGFTGAGTGNVYYDTGNHYRFTISAAAGSSYTAQALRDCDDEDATAGPFDEIWSISSTLISPTQTLLNEDKCGSFSLVKGLFN